MGHSYRLTNLVNLDDNIWFTEHQWDLYASKAAELIHAWFSKLDPAAKMDLTHTTEGMFKTDLSDSVASVKQLTEIFKAKDEILFAVRNAGEPFWIEGKGRSLAERGLITTIQCYTGDHAAYDPLVAALYVLASITTGYRLNFVSTRTDDELQRTISCFSRYMMTDFDPYNQDYKDYLHDEKILRAVLADALENNHDPDEYVIEVFNDVYPGGGFHSGWALQSTYEHLGRDLLTELNKKRLADYYLGSYDSWRSFTTKSAAKRARELFATVPYDRLRDNKKVLSMCFYRLHRRGMQAFAHLRCEDLRNAA